MHAEGPRLDRHAVGETKPERKRERNCEGERAGWTGRELRKRFFARPVPAECRRHERRRRWRVAVVTVTAAAAAASAAKAKAKAKAAEARDVLARGAHEREWLGGRRKLLRVATLRDGGDGGARAATRRYYPRPTAAHAGPRDAAPAARGFSALAPLRRRCARVG